MEANFIVTEQGYMKTVYGEIGPFDINTDGFWYGSYNNPTAGILCSGNMSYMFSTIGNFSEINSNVIYANYVYSHNIFPNLFSGIGEKEDFTINDKRILTTDDLSNSSYSPNIDSINLDPNTCPYMKTSRTFERMVDTDLGIDEDWTINDMII
jgi:hypothetical protein